MEQWQAQEQKAYCVPRRELGQDTLIQRTRAKSKEENF